MKNSSLLSIIVLCIFCSDVLSQNLQRAVISSSGSYTSADGIQLSWTLSESFHTQKSSDNITITEGFEQILIGPITSSEGQLLINEVSVYPNPFANQINLNIDAPELSDVRLQIYDIRGKTYWQTTNSGHHTIINSALWPSGMYIIRITNEKGLRIIKKISKL